MKRIKITGSKHTLERGTRGAVVSVARWDHEQPFVILAQWPVQWGLVFAHAYDVLREKSGNVCFTPVFPRLVAFSSLHWLVFIFSPLLLVAIRCPFSFHLVTTKNLFSSLSMVHPVNKLLHLER